MDIRKITLFFILRRIGLILLVLALLAAGIFWGGTALIVHRLQRTAEKVIDVDAQAYIARQYPDNDFDIAPASYPFKAGCYRVHVTSRSSRDTYFHLDYDRRSHELISDTYENDVLRKGNTRDRLVKEYDAAVNTALGSMPSLYRLDCKFSRYSEKGASESFSPTGLDSSTLILDGEYDVAVTGDAYGLIDARFLDSNENINIQRLLELLLEMGRLLTERTAITRKRDALSCVPSLISENAHCIEGDADEGQNQTGDAAADDDVELLDGEVHLVVPAFLGLLPHALGRLLLDGGLLLHFNILFFHYFLATYLRISIATAVMTTRPWTM